MTKQGQTLGHERDDAKSTVPGLSHPPRGPDERVVLVTERYAVWDRKATAMPTAEEVPTYEVTALGPMPTAWTADLVHCRLLVVDAIANRLPRQRVPASYRSFLGELQPQEAAPGRSKGLSQEETRRFDWTMSRLLAWPDIDRAVLMGMMTGKSLRLIARITEEMAARIGGKPYKKSTVSDRYRYMTTVMANDWIAAKEPIDDTTRKCWMQLAEKKQ